VDTAGWFAVDLLTGALSGRGVQDHEANKWTDGTRALLPDYVTSGGTEFPIEKISTVSVAS